MDNVIEKVLTIKGIFQTKVLAEMNIQTQFQYSVSTNSRDKLIMHESVFLEKTDNHSRYLGLSITISVSDGRRIIQ